MKNVENFHIKSHAFFIKISSSFLAVLIKQSGKKNYTMKLTVVFLLVAFAILVLAGE